MANLITEAVHRGQWIVFGGANQGDLSPKYVTIGEVSSPVYVDGTNYRVRCPEDIGKGNFSVIFDGIVVGTIQVF